MIREAEVAFLLEVRERMYVIKTVDLESGQRRWGRKRMTKREAKEAIAKARETRRKGSRLVSAIEKVAP